MLQKNNPSQEILKCIWCHSAPEQEPYKMCNECFKERDRKREQFKKLEWDRNKKALEKDTSLTGSMNRFLNGGKF